MASTSYNQSEDDEQRRDLKDVGIKKKFKPFKAIRRIIRDGKKNVRVPTIFKGQSLPEEDLELSSAPHELDRRISLSHDSIFNPEPNLLETPISHAQQSAPKPIVKPRSKTKRDIPNEELLSPNVASQFKDELNSKLNLKPRARSQTTTDDHVLSTSAPSAISFFSMKPRVTIKQISMKDPQSEETTFPVDSRTDKDENVLKLKHSAAYAKIEARPKNRKPRRKLKLFNEENNAEDPPESMVLNNPLEIPPLEQDITITTDDKKEEIQSKKFLNNEDKDDLEIHKSSVSLEIDTSVMSKPSCDDAFSSTHPDGDNSSHLTTLMFQGSPQLDDKFTKYGRSHSENQVLQVTNSTQELIKTFSYDADKQMSKPSIKRERSKEVDLFEIPLKISSAKDHSKNESFKTISKKGLTPMGSDERLISQSNVISEMSDARASSLIKESDIATSKENLQEVNNSQALTKSSMKDDETLESPIEVHGTKASSSHGVLQQQSSTKQTFALKKDKPDTKLSSKVVDETSKVGMNSVSDSTQGSILKKLKNVNHNDSEKPVQNKDKSKSRSKSSSTKIASNPIREEKVSAGKEVFSEETSPKVTGLKTNKNLHLASLSSVKLRKTGPKKQLVAHNPNYIVEEMESEKEINTNKRNGNNTNTDAISYWEKKSVNKNRYSDSFDPRDNTFSASPTLKKPTVARSASAKVGHKGMSLTKDIPTDEKDSSLLNSSAPAWISMARKRSKKWGQLNATDDRIKQTGESNEANVIPLSKDATSIDSLTSPLLLESGKNTSEAVNIVSTNETLGEKSPTFKNESAMSGNEQIEKRLLEQSDDPPWLAVAMAKQQRWSYGGTV